MNRHKQPASPTRYGCRSFHTASAIPSPDQTFYRVATSRKTWVRKSTLVFEPTTAGAEFANFIADYSDHVPVITSLYTDAP